MKRARSSEVFIGVGRLRARRGLAPLLAAAAFAYLLFVSVKLTYLGSAGPAPAFGRLDTTGAGEPAARARSSGGGAVSGYGRITGEILRRHEAFEERRKRWGQLGNFTELERVAAEAWALERGYTAVCLRSNQRRVDAHRFYKRLGYEIVKSQFTFSRSLSPVTPASPPQPQRPAEDSAAR